MHFSQTAFTENGMPTVLSRDNQFSSFLLFHNEHPDKTDFLHINLLYCGGEYAWHAYGFTVYAAKSNCMVVNEFYLLKLSSPRCVKNKSYESYFHFQ